MKPALSLLIIGTLTAIVSLSITRIVMVAFSDEYSNVHLVGVAAQEMDFIHDAANAQDLTEEESFPVGAAPVQCDPPPATTVPYSIVDYLKERNLPTQFADRASLAKDYQINDYKGTSQQNLFLFVTLRKIDMAKGLCTSR